jgi:hypothetical protein
MKSEKRIYAIFISYIGGEKMVRVVLTTDETLTSTYHDVPLLDFLGCAPYGKFPEWIYHMLDTQIPDENGVLT